MVLILLVDGTLTNKKKETLPVLKINNINLSYYSENKFLGFLIYDMLLFASHISKFRSKISCNIGLLFF